MSSSTAEPQKKFNKGRLAAFAFGNFGQSLLYNALSTYFMVFATNALFAGVDKTTAADMTQANITTFEGFAFWMPLAFIIIGFLIFAFFVKIDERLTPVSWPRSKPTCTMSPMPLSTARTSPRPRCSARSPQPGKPSNA